MSWLSRSASRFRGCLRAPPGPVLGRGARGMGGGAHAKPLYSRHMHPPRKPQLILRFCDHIFGLEPYESASRNKERETKVEGLLAAWRRPRPGQWVCLDTLLYDGLFRGWTKKRTLLQAFERDAKGRYEVASRCGTSFTCDTPSRELTKLLFRGGRQNREGGFRRKTAGAGAA